MAFQRPSQSRLLAVALSILLFAVSLALPAFYSDGSDQTAGWSAFLSGWIPALFDLVKLPRGQFEDWTCMAWFANPALVVCWVLAAMHRRRLALAFGAAALGLGLMFLATKELPMGDHELKGVMPGSGYWLWITSMLAAIVAAALGKQPGGAR